MGAIGTYIEFVATAVENGVASDLIRGEGRVNIQLTVSNEKVLVERGCHFKFVVTGRVD